MLQKSIQNIREAISLQNVMDNLDLTSTEREKQKDEIIHLLKESISEILEDPIYNKVKTPVKSSIRPKVLKWARVMEEVLRNNDYKGGWTQCSIHYLLEKLDEEVTELKDAIKSGMAINGRIVQEAADVSNIAMMIADNLGDFMRRKESNLNEEQ